MWNIGETCGPSAKLSVALTESFENVTEYEITHKAARIASLPPKR